MKLTIVGKSPAWQDAGGASSGYLVEEDGARLLLDCGSGVFGRLRDRIDFLSVDDVLISHMHGDHFLDLISFSYGLLYSPRQLAAERVRPMLHLPPGGTAVLRTLIGTFAEADLVERAFAVREYDPAAELSIGGLRVRFAEVPHFVTTYAVDLTGHDGARLTFSADCGPNEALVALARDTDLLLVEATLADAPAGASSGHMSAAEAGSHAARAGAARMLLTHFSDEYDATAVLAAAARTFSGPIDAARPGAVHRIERLRRPTNDNGPAARGSRPVAQPGRVSGP